MFLEWLAFVLLFIGTYVLVSLTLYPFFMRVFSGVRSSELHVTLALWISTFTLLSGILLVTLLRVNYTHLTFEQSLFQTYVFLVPIGFLVSVLLYLCNYFSRTQKPKWHIKLESTILLLGIIGIGMYFIGLLYISVLFSGFVLHIYLIIFMFSFIPIVIWLIYRPVRIVFRKMMYRNVIAVLVTLLIVSVIAAGILIIDHLLRTIFEIGSPIGFMILHGGIVALHMMILYTNIHIIMRLRDWRESWISKILLYSSVISIVAPLVLYYWVR